MGQANEVGPTSIEGSFYSLSLCEQYYRSVKLRRLFFISLLSAISVISVIVYLCSLMSTDLNHAENGQRDV